MTVQTLAKNQLVVTTNYGKYFQSYVTVISYISAHNKKVLLDKNFWDYSRTTLKYLCQFLGVANKKAIQQKIDSGEYQLTDLSKIV